MGIAYDRVLRSVKAQVERHGVSCEVEARKPLRQRRLEAIEESVGIRLPGQIRRLYCEFSDGIRLRWVCGEQIDPSLQAHLEIPAIGYITGDYESWSETISYVEGIVTDIDDKSASGMSAEQVLESMYGWFPVIDEGNGDKFCIDCLSDGEPIVFYQHDWFDAAGECHWSGHVVAPSWESFIEDWASVCFQFPRDWWARAFSKRGGVKWAGNQFRDPFRLRMR